MVLHPLKVTLENVGESESFKIAAPDFPRDAILGSHALTVSRTVFIDREDFREVDDASYFGLAPGKVAGLRYAGFVRVTRVDRDASGAVTGLFAEYDHSRSPAFAGGAKVKGNLHWVSAGATPCEVRLYDHLFLENADGGELAELNPSSEVIVHGALADMALSAPGRAPMRSHFQFERVGFFTADSDTKDGALVFNLTVGLKEGTEVKKVRG